MTQQFTSYSQSETEALGARFSKTLCAGVVTALRGELGVGKTAFVRGVLAGLGHDAEVTSPTFTIVNEYRAGGFTVDHFDMYRIESEDALYSTGFYDYLDGNRILFIEWSENIDFALDFPHITVSFEKLSETGRSIIFEGAKEL